jgi:aryl-alcohol dehydrogenase-like predicted oxidoreductase
MFRIMDRMHRVPICRRDFLLRGATGLAALRSFPHHLFAGATAKQATDRIKLGPRGVEVSRLAMGTGTSGVGGSSNQTKKLGVQGMTELFQFGFDHGLTFWDSADQYGTHLHMKAALKVLKRDKIAIMTKTHATTAREMREDLDRFRREIGTDYIDIVLLHAMTDGDWPEKKKGAMEVLSEAREKGIVRTHGTSCHSFDAMKAALKSPWCEVDLARINPAKIAMDADPQTILDLLAEMKAAGKGVIGMKILGAGRLRSKPDECLQFALANDQVDAFTIGAESVVELGDLVKKIPAASVRG